MVVHFFVNFDIFKRLYLAYVCLVLHGLKLGNEVIIDSIRQQARADNLQICYRKKKNKLMSATSTATLTML